MNFIIENNLQIPAMIYILLFIIMIITDRSFAKKYILANYINVCCWFSYGILCIYIIIKYELLTLTNINILTFIIVITILFVFYKTISLLKDILSKRKKEDLDR